MSYLYVVLFSDGLIKVGRSKTPLKRIDEHEYRVSCTGLTKVASCFFPVSGRVSDCEMSLIGWCKANSTASYLREWFRGVEYKDAVNAALEASLTKSDVQEKTHRDNDGVERFITLAGGRKQLAAMLGVAPITTYRWTGDLSQKHEDRLRVLKPTWFRKKKVEK